MHPVTHSSPRNVLKPSVLYKVPRSQVNKLVLCLHCCLRDDISGPLCTLNCIMLESPR